MRSGTWEVAESSLIFSLAQPLAVSSPAITIDLEKIDSSRSQTKSEQRQSRSHPLTLENLEDRIALASDITVITTGDE